MQKLTGSFILAMALFFLSLPNVHADEFSIAIGIKARFNELRIRLANESVKFDSQDVGLLSGPSLKMAYGKFFAVYRGSKLQHVILWTSLALRQIMMVPSISARVISIHW